MDIVQRAVTLLRILVAHTRRAFFCPAIMGSLVDGHDEHARLFNNVEANLYGLPLAMSSVQNSDTNSEHHVSNRFGMLPVIVRINSPGQDLNIIGGLGHPSEPGGGGGAVESLPNQGSMMRELWGIPAPQLQDVAQPLWGNFNGEPAFPMGPDAYTSEFSHSGCLDDSQQCTVFPERRAPIRAKRLECPCYQLA